MQFEGDNYHFRITQYPVKHNDSGSRPSRIDSSAAPLWKLQNCKIYLYSSSDVVYNKCVWRRGVGCLLMIVPYDLFSILVVKCRNWIKITDGLRKHAKWQRRWALVCRRLTLVPTVCWRKLQSSRRNMNLRWLHSEVCFFKQNIKDHTWKHSWRTDVLYLHEQTWDIFWWWLGWSSGQQNEYFSEKYDFMHSRTLNYWTKYKEIQ